MKKTLIALAILAGALAASPASAAWQDVRLVDAVGTATTWYGTHMAVAATATSCEKIWENLNQTTTMYEKIMLATAATATSTEKIWENLVHSTTTFEMLVYATAATATGVEQIWENLVHSTTTFEMIVYATAASATSGEQIWENLVHSTTTFEMIVYATAASATAGEKIWENLVHSTTTFEMIVLATAASATSGEAMRLGIEVCSTCCDQLLTAVLTLTHTITGGTNVTISNTQFTVWQGLDLWAVALSETGTGYAPHNVAGTVNISTTQITVWQGLDLWAVALSETGTGWAPHNVAGTVGVSQTLTGQAPTPVAGTVGLSQTVTGWAPINVFDAGVYAALNSPTTLDGNGAGKTISWSGSNTAWGNVAFVGGFARYQDGSFVPLTITSTANGMWVTGAAGFLQVSSISPITSHPALGIRGYELASAGLSNINLGAQPGAAAMTASFPVCKVNGPAVAAGSDRWVVITATPYSSGATSNAGSASAVSSVGAVGSETTGTIFVDAAQGGTMWIPSGANWYEIMVDPASTSTDGVYSSFDSMASAAGGATGKNWPLYNTVGRDKRYGDNFNASAPIPIYCKTAGGGGLRLYGRFGLVK